MYKTVFEIFPAIFLGKFPETSRYFFPVETLFGYVLETVFSTQYDDQEITCSVPSFCLGLDSTAVHHPFSVDLEVSEGLTPSSLVQPADTYNFARANYEGLLAELSTTDWNSEEVKIVPIHILGIHLCLG